MKVLGCRCTEAGRYRTASEGFTLIELMIVVAIIGILASIAVPSYRDYTARTQVSEAVRLLAGLKTGLHEHYLDKQVWPHDLTAVSGVNSRGKYVDSLTIVVGANSNGLLVVAASFKPTGVHALLQNETLALATVDGGRTWQCGSNGSNSAGHTSVRDEHLPQSCK